MLTINHALETIVKILIYILCLSLLFLKNLCVSCNIKLTALNIYNNHNYSIIVTDLLIFDYQNKLSIQLLFYVRLHLTTTF